MADRKITTLFLDIGGVLLTNGWGRTVRKEAADAFQIDFGDMDERHHLSFNSYEDGKLTLDQYLDQVVFHQERDFDRSDFKSFMFSQSQPYPEMIDYIRALKVRYRLRTVAVSNEGRELTAYRVEKFALKDAIDFFVVSCYVHFRKPDRDIYQLAIDLSQARPEQVAYLDDRPLFVEVASELGIQAICHSSIAATQLALSKLGLSL